MVALLLARILAVSDSQHLGEGVEVAPGDPADFLLPHRRRHRELDNPAHGEKSAERVVQRNGYRDDMMALRARSGLGDPRWHGRAAHPQAAQGELLPLLPGAQAAGREGSDRRQ